jgi:heme exporter protein C
MKGTEKLAKVLGIIIILLIAKSLYGAFVAAPTERIMGDVQRIFYFHVPVAIQMTFSYFIVLIASILYLVKRDLFWDRLAVCAAELGVLFTSLVLITGVLWAKPVWNTWWTWDPRLVTTLIAWFIYVTYFMLRSSVSDPGKRARFSAVIGIIGFIDIPIVRLSTKWWRSIHPLLSQEGGGLAPEMLTVMLWSLAAFTLLTVWLLWYRFSLSQLDYEIQKLKTAIETED